MNNRYTGPAPHERLTGYKPRITSFPTISKKRAIELRKELQELKEIEKAKK